ncbi:MAG: DNA-3-methyladenine glycosylase [Marinoscillum sp.]
MNDLSSYEKLPLTFYKRSDVVEVARDLLGKYLCTNIGGKITVGKIVETEAYSGQNDKACHAHKGLTKRTSTMYQEGGRAYVYLCYGIHHLFNIVTNEDGLADAVLIRAVEPMINTEVMQERRGTKVAYKKLTAGPGTLTQALGIVTEFNGSSLLDDQIWVAKVKQSEPFKIVVDRRIGVDYAGEDAFLPWRFFIRGNEFVSKPKQMV